MLEKTDYLDQYSLRHNWQVNYLPEIQGSAEIDVMANICFLVDWSIFADSFTQGIPGGIPSPPVGAFFEVFCFQFFFFERASCEFSSLELLELLFFLSSPPFSTTMIFFKFERYFFGVLYHGRADCGRVLRSVTDGIVKSGSYKHRIGCFLTYLDSKKL